MTLQSVAPLRFKGVKSDWLTTLPDSGTEMLTISSTGVVSRQAIPSASFGALTGLPSDNAALASVLAAKVNLAGDTMTGQLNGTTVVLSGTEGLTAPKMQSAAGQLLVIDGKTGISIRHNSSHQHAFATGSFTTRGDNVIQWTSGSDMSHPVDARFARNTTGQVDYRGNGGFRFRNFVNNADAPITASLGTFSTGIDVGADFGTNQPRIRFGTVNPSSIGSNYGNLDFRTGSGTHPSVGYTSRLVIDTSGATRIGENIPIQWRNGDPNGGATLGFITVSGSPSQIMQLNANGSVRVQSNGGLAVNNQANSAGAPLTAGAISGTTGSFSDTGTSTLSVTSSSTNVATFGVVNSSSNVGWGFQVAGSSPLTGAPAGSFTFRQTTNDINAGIIASDGRWFIGQGTPLTATQFAVVSRAAGNTVEAIRGAASQTGNLTEWQNNSGTVLGSVSASGNIALTGSNPQVRLGAVDQGFVEYSSGDLNLGHTYATRLAVNASQVTSLVPMTISSYPTSSVGLTIQRTPGVGTDLMQWKNDSGTLLGRITDIGDIHCPRISPGTIQGSPTVNPGTLFFLDTNHSIRALVGQGLALYTFGVNPGIFLQQSTGNVGFGTTSPNAGLVIRRSGATLPSMRLEDGDITVPFTGASFNPALGANTIGDWSAAASASGGMLLSGFTNNTAAAYPLGFSGYHGSASPTTPAVCFSGNKTNGSTGSTTLASSELIAGFYNGDVSGTPVMTIAANGAVTANHALRLATHDTGLYFGPSGNTHRISSFSNDLYYDVSASAGRHLFRSTNSTSSLMTLETTQNTSHRPFVASSTISAAGSITHGFQTLVANPSTVDITTGLSRMVKNSTSGDLRIWANDGGSMKSVLLS